MKVKITSNISLGVKELEIDKDSITLEDVLSWVNSKQERVLPFVDPATSELDELFEIGINGRDCRYMPQRLNTALKDGDLVEIFIVAVGGG
jgi:molybdopterin converting factor small subunit